MKEKHHPEREELIDFTEGELAPERAGEIDAHLKDCKECAAYVESVRQTFSLLAHDTVPEPEPGYWAYLPQRARQRAGSRRRRWILVLAPGMAALALILVFVWWGARAPVTEMDPVEMITAELTTEELVESVSANEVYDDILLEAAEEEITMIDEYFHATEDIYDLINILSDAEAEALVAELNNLMKDNESTSKVMTDFPGKEC